MSLNTQSLWFLQSAFGDSWPQAWVEWWRFDQESGEVDPSTHRWARAKDADPDEKDSVYYCVGLITPGKRRLNAHVRSVHVLVLDDVGTKIDREMVELFLPARPSAVIETSRGNFQYVWFCPDGMTVPQFHQVRRGLTDKFGPCDCWAPSSLARLPMGVNGKPYRILDPVWRIER